MRARRWRTVPAVLAGAQTPNPANGCEWGRAAAYPQMCMLAHTPAVTTSPGLVHLGSMDGKFRVYSSRTGRVLWEYDTVRDFAAGNGPGQRAVRQRYYPVLPEPIGTEVSCYSLSGCDYLRRAGL